MSRTRDAIVSALVLLLGRGRHRPPKDPERVVPALSPSPRAETAAIVLFFAASVAAVGFIVAYALAPMPHETQWLGLSLGLSLVAIAAALIVVAKKLVATEQRVEPYTPEEHPHE